MKVKIKSERLGFADTLDTSKLTQAQRNKLLEYGARRWFLDSMNRGAFIAKHKEKPFSANAAYKETLEKL